MAQASKNINWLGYIRNSAYLFCTTYVVTRHVGEFVICSGDSMIPAIHSGDVCLTEKLSVKSGNIQKGDIVCATSPYNNKVLFCKRNWTRAIGKSRITYEQRYENPLFRVPPGHLFLVGDNASVSNDSREFGPIPYGLVQVRVIYRIWPLNRMGWLSTHAFNERST